MAIANLNSEPEQIITGNDNIVIKKYIHGIEGGRTLDVTGFAPEVIKAGHVIIKETASGEYKPMPVTGSGKLEALGTITGGSAYTDGTYNGVGLTGGSGSGATANITVSGGVVTDVSIVSGGTGYAAGDDLSAAAANIGGTGSGFSVEVATVDTLASQYGSLPGGHVYVGVLRASILTKTPLAGIMTWGVINAAAAPFPMDSILSAFMTAVKHISNQED